LMRKCAHAIVALALLLGVVLVAANSTSLVAADSCVAQLGNSSLSTTQYYNSNAQIVVPVSTSCSFSGGQLYAVGNLFDTSTNSNLGSANTILTPVDGGNTFSGQLVFNLLALMQSDTLQISVSIYNNGLNGSLLTSATQTLQVNGTTYYGNPGYYWYYPSYPSYQWSPSDPSYPSNPLPSPVYHDHLTPPSPPPGHHDNPSPPGHHDNPSPPSTPPHNSHH